MTKSGKIRSWEQALPKSGVVVIVGHRGMGKSGLAWWLAEQTHKAKRQVIAFGAPKVAKKLLPKWVEHVAEIQKLARRRGALVIIDEAAFRVMARRHQAQENILWAKMVAISRHKEHLLLFVTQTTRQIDISLMGDADLVVFKKPSLLHIRFSRPEFRTDVEEAYQVLSAKGKGAKSWSMVKDFSNGKTGMLKNTLPSFWSDELSRSFALVELENGEPAKKKKRGGATRLKLR